MSSTFIVTVHACGGSTGEAIDVDWGFTVQTEAEAEQMCEMLNVEFANYGFDGSTREELYAVWAELPDLRDLAVPTAKLTPAQLAQTPGYNPDAEGQQVALDIRAWIKELAERTDNDTLDLHVNGQWESAFPAMKPPVVPVTAEEEEEVRRILGINQPLPTGDPS